VVVITHCVILLSLRNTVKGSQQHLQVANLTDSFTHRCCGSCGEMIHANWNHIRASPPLRSKGTLQALWSGLAQKFAPPFLPGLLKLARALQTSGSTHYPPGWALLLRSPNSGTSSTWDLWIVPLLGWSHFTRNGPGGFSGWRASMQGKGGGVPP